MKQDLLTFKTNAPVGFFSNCRGVLLCVLVTCSGILGCYDGQALIDARREVAVRARLVEVDLGEYQVTLPRPYSKLERAQVDFHVFGQIAHSDLKQAKKTLKARDPDLRHRLLLAVRQMNMDEIADPSLKSLRANIVEAVNEMVEGEPVQSVGFYSFTFSDY